MTKRREIASKFGALFLPKQGGSENLLDISALFSKNRDVLAQAFTLFSQTKKMFCFSNEKYPLFC